MSQLQLHLLVRDVTAHTLTRPEPTDTWLAAIDDHLARAVEATTSMPGRTGWPTALLLTLHLRSHLDRSTQRDFSTAVDTLDSLTGALSNAGAAFEVLLLRRHVLDAETRVLGPAHPGTLTSRNNLANALDSLGDQQAADLHRQNLTDYERALDPDHPNTLGSRHNLAVARARLAEGRTAVVAATPP